MTPDEAADLAARTLAAIDGVASVLTSSAWQRVFAADRERVASDLAGLARHPDNEDAADCERCGWGFGCPDAAAYADGLRRTASLYGVTP